MCSEIQQELAATGGLRSLASASRSTSQWVSSTFSKLLANRADGEIISSVVNHRETHCCHAVRPSR
jgi:hypothetical protein